MLFGLMVGCQEPDDDTVRSTLGGRITVDTSIDASGDHSGFRVLVAHAQGRSIDTLAHAVTDSTGAFQTAVHAPHRGVYPLLLWGRDGRRQLASTDLVVAEGDSARLDVTLPRDAPRIRVRSRENDAWAGYQSALTQHRRTLLRRLEGGISDINVTSQGVRQTSSILWSLRDTYPGTYAAQLAAIESLSLLEGWNDSLLVKRVDVIDPSNPRYAEAARIGRRAMDRLRGREASWALLDSLEARAQTEEQRAGVQAARIRAFVDSQQTETAVAAARTLRSKYPDTRWAEWADRVQYGIQALQPGRSAPAISARTTQGDSLSLEQLRGQPVVLEFYRPEQGLYARQLPLRNALYRATRPDSVAFVSVSVEPDTVVNKAFLSNRALPGYRIIAPGGDAGPLARAYNVVHTPVRFLIGPEGKIEGRYTGSTLLALQNDLLALLDDMPPTLHTP